MGWGSRLDNPGQGTRSMLNTVEPGVSHAAPTGLVVSIKHGCSWLRSRQGVRGQGLAESRHDSRVGAIMTAATPSGTKSTCETDRSTTGRSPGLSAALRHWCFYYPLGHTHCFAHTCCRGLPACGEPTSALLVRVGEEGGLPAAQGARDATGGASDPAGKDPPRVLTWGSG